MAWRTTRPLLLGANLAMAWPTTAHAYRLAGESDEFGGQERVADADAHVVVRLRGRTPRSVTISELDQAVRAAVDAWNAVPCSRLQIVYEGITESAPESDDGVTTIDTLGSGWVAMGNLRDAPAATLSTYSRASGTWAIADGDIYLNDDTIDWALVGVDPTTVVMHELGHRLGLAHPCGEETLLACDPASPPLMGPVYDGAIVAPRADDVAGLCFLYPSDACSTVSCGPGEICDGGTCVGACDGAVCAEEEVCELGRCVPDCTADRCTRSCAADSDCSNGERCAEALCQPATGQTGDPCETPHDCASGECQSGYCSESCSMTCSYGYECAADAGVCVATLATFGAGCATGADCASGRCYQSTQGAALCTRLCDPAADCPAGFECADVDGRRVCRPPPQLGCSAQPGVSVSGAPWLVLLVLAWTRRATR